MLGGADNPNGELPSYITGANSSSANTATVCPRGFYPVKQRYGAPRLTDELRAQGYPFNVKPWRQACAVRD